MPRIRSRATCAATAARLQALVDHGINISLTRMGQGLSASMADDPLILALGETPCSADFVAVPDMMSHGDRVPDVRLGSLVGASSPSRACH